MKKNTILCVFVIMSSVIFYSCTKKSDHSVLEGSYLGQKPPGDEPELFAPGIISSCFHEHSFPTFSPDGKEVRWTVIIQLVGQGWGSGEFFRSKILSMKVENGIWSSPQLTDLATLHQELEGFFSPDGKKYFYASRQPTNGNDNDNPLNNIWVVERQKEEWSKPIPLGPKINTENSESAPSTTFSGTLYFKGFWDGGEYDCGIYRSEYKDGEYSDPELLPESINTPYFERTPFISPDESYLLFASNRPGGYGSTDIYISFRNDDGSWTKSINLGLPINSECEERYPYVSPDGKYLFFVTNKFLYENELESEYSYYQLLDVTHKPGNGANDIYWVDAKIIDELKLNQ